MTKRERIMSLFDSKSADRVGFWKGNPHEDTVKIYCKYFGIEDDRDLLADKFNDDFNWIAGEGLSWKHPDNKPIFDVLGGKERISLSQAGVFSDTTDIKEIENFNWPDPNYLDFTDYEKAIDKTIERGLAVCGGMWSPFYHIIQDFFGMEDYFCKMYTDPLIVEAVTQHVVDFYMEANRRCFEKLASKIDIFFLGNDFGSQRDLQISPEMFNKFVLPSFQKLIDLAKSYGLKVMLHSCGSIYKVIPHLIDAGVDAIHPLQAKAANMEADKLAKFNKDIVFVGGIDTQELLPCGTPQQIKDEVKRVKDILGPGMIVSPSHEALLPDVPVENALAMMEAALDI